MSCLAVTTTSYNKTLLETDKLIKKIKNYKNMNTVFSLKNNLNTDNFVYNPNIIYNALIS